MKNIKFTGDAHIEDSSKRNLYNAGGLKRKKVIRKKKAEMEKKAFLEYCGYSCNSGRWNDCIFFF